MPRVPAPLVASDTPPSCGSQPQHAFPKNIVCRLGPKRIDPRQNAADGRAIVSSASWASALFSHCDRKGFHVQPRRWVVERSFSWFGRNRRLAKDYENLADTLAAFVTIAAISLALRRLARLA